MRSQRGMERPAVIGRWVGMELTEAGIWSFPNPAAASLVARRAGASFQVPFREEAPFSLGTFALLPF